MLAFVTRRALAQRRVLTAVAVLVTLATTLLGVCALLLGPTQDRAFATGVGRLEPPDVDVTAYVVDVDGADLPSARTDAETLVRDVLSGLRPTVTSAATSRMRRLDAADGLGYLATGDLERHASLADGRWPAAPGEAAVPAVAAERLGLALGDQVTLGAETGLESAHDPVGLVVVGTFRATDPAGWSSDPLSGAGFDPAYSDGSRAAPTYGPFVVDDQTLLASGSHVAGLRVTGDPTLAGADDPALSTAAAALGGGSARLSAQLGDRARITRLASDLPRTLDRLHAQIDSTRSTVLVVLLLVAALALGALLLAGQLVAAVRDDERALLVAFGLSPGQQLRLALLEALLVALVAAVVAVPAAALTHAALTHLDAVRAAGLTQPPEVTGGLVLTVLVGAAVLASALAAPALGRDPATRPRTRRRVVVDVGTDVLLVAVAVVAWWQLDAQPDTAAATGDTVATLAPVACLLAVTTVVVRRLPPLLARLARSGHGAVSLVLPLAAAQTARRPRTGLALVLLAAAVAAVTFAAGLQATWQRSQHDQADLRVGTDLALALTAPATLADARAVADGTSGAVLSPVADSAVALGRYVGTPDSRPALVALDATRAGALLRGRLAHGSWRDLAGELAPGDPVRGVPLADGAPLTLAASAPVDDALDLDVEPTAVVEGAGGLRYDVSAPPVPADGRAHPLRWLSPLGAGRLVAVRLEVRAHGVDPTAPLQPVPLSATLRVGGTTDARAADWRLSAVGRDTPVRSSELAVRAEGDAVVLRATAEVEATYLAYDSAVLLATAFEPPDAVPAVLSQAAASATGARVGGALAATVGGSEVLLRVAAVVPSVPSRPGGVAVLTDLDTLSRVLIGAGRLDPVVNGWWVADPGAGAAQRLRPLGTVVSRAEVTDELTRGPLRVTTPTALVVLGGAGVLLLLAGAGLVVGSDQRRRAAEVARLRALGLSRSDARRLLVAEHTLLLAPLVVLGAAVGAAATWALGPLLVRSDLGAAPVPPAAAVWPWSTEGLLVGGLLVGAVAVAVVVATLQVRRAEPTLLRTDEG